MVCKRYGVPTKDFNFERIPEELKQMTPQEVKAELGKGRECFEILAEGMDRDVGMQNRNKPNREYERQEILWKMKKEQLKWIELFMQL